MLPVFVRMDVRVLVVVRVVMVVRSKALVPVGVPDRLRWLPAREVTVSTPMRMSVDMSSVPVTSNDVHPATVARSCSCGSQASTEGSGRLPGPVSANDPELTAAVAVCPMLRWSERMKEKSRHGIARPGC